MVFKKREERERMKKLTLLVAVVFAVSVLVVLGGKDAFAKEYKIGYVDPVKGLNEYNKTKDSEKTFETKRKTKEAERKKLTDDITKLKQEQGLLSEKAKAEKQKTIDDKMRLLQEFDKKTREELMGEGNELLGSIQKDIEKVINNYAKEGGYDIILNQRVMLYGREEYDVTADILKKLNAGK
jgi:outer membrane protein